MLGLFAIVVSWGAFAGSGGANAAEGLSEDSYHDLWMRGEYRKALELLEPLLDSISGAPPRRYLRHRAELRFATGRVDEAIEDMVSLSKRYREPGLTLELALMYRYRGKPLNFEQALQRAYARVQSRRWRWSQQRDENLVAIPRIHELLGENPKTLLSAVYAQIIEHNPDLAAAHIGAGDVAYRNSGYDVASRYYTRALEIEAENQEALAGLAECYWKSSDGRLEATMEVLLGLNPHHPRARRIRVEQLLDLGRSGAALELIGEGLEINPWDLHLLSLKSAAHFLEDDRKAMRATQARTLDFNAVWSDLYGTTGRIASRHYRFEQGAEFQRKALELDPKDYRARANYTLDLMRLGRESEGREELERAFEGDPYNVQVFNLLELMDSLAQFSTIERDSFVLRMPEHEVPVLATEALDLLDTAKAHFQEKYDVKLAKPVLVEMFDEHDDFMVRSVGLPGSVGHLGICFGKVITMDTPSVRSKGSSNWRSVLFHEFVHVITLQKTENRMPRWLSEGISVYEEGQYAAAWKSKLDPDYLPIVTEEELPRLGDLAGYFTQPKSTQHLLFGYFVAGEFVQFFVDTYGFDGLVDALNGIRRGKGTVTALAEGAGVSLKALDKAFLVYLDARLKPFENLTVEAKRDGGLEELIKDFLNTSEGQDASGIAEALAERPGSKEPAVSPFSGAMARAAEAVAAADWEVAEEALKEAHAFFPEYTGHDAPLRQLARLYERLERRDDLRATLKEIAYWTSTELDACLRLLELLREEEDWDEAVQTAKWVLGIDPYDVTTRRDLLDMMGSSTEEDRVHTMLRHIDALMRLDPTRASEYRLRKVRLLTEREDWGLAKTEVLRLLEELPHYWEAQELLLDIVDRRSDDEKAVDAGRPEPTS